MSGASSKILGCTVEEGLNESSAYYWVEFHLHTTPTGYRRLRIGISRNEIVQGSRLPAPDMIARMAQGEDVYEPASKLIEEARAMKKRMEGINVKTLLDEELAKLGGETKALLDRVRQEESWPSSSTRRRTGGDTFQMWKALRDELKERGLEPTLPPVRKIPPGKQ